MSRYVIAVVIDDPHDRIAPHEILHAGDFLTERIVVTGAARKVVTTFAGDLADRVAQCVQDAIDAGQDGEPG